MTSESTASESTGTQPCDQLPQRDVEAPARRIYQQNAPREETFSAPQPSTTRIIFIMFGLCLAVFLTGMDQTILAAATPAISNEFHTLQDLAWWTNAYLLTLSSFQLFYGKMYSVFHIKFVYLFAIAIFEVGILICTVASNSVILIVGRAIAGLGAAGIFSGGILTTTILIPLSRRAAYLGVMSGVFGLAGIIGPLVGGALTDATTWRWCFGINLPLGAVTVVLCALLVRTPKNPSTESFTLLKKLNQLDIPGTVCLVASVTCLLIALQWGGARYSWSNGRVIALFVVCAVFAIAFIVFQATALLGRAKTIPSSLASNRDIWLAASYAVCMTGGVYVPVLYLPIWFQTVRGYSPLKAGVMLTPLIASYVLCSVIAGGVTAKIGYYNPAMIAGTALSIAGAAVLTTIHVDTSTARIVGYQLLYGFGIGFGFGQPSYVVQTLLPTVDVPVGVAFITLVMSLSASIFVAVAQSILQGQLQSRLNGRIPGLNVSSLLNSGTADFRASLPVDMQQVAITAFSDSVIATFYVSLGLSCASIFGAACIRWGSMKKVNVDDLTGNNEKTEDAMPIDWRQDAMGTNP